MLSSKTINASREGMAGNRSNCGRALYRQINETTLQFLRRDDIRPSANYPKINGRIGSSFHPIGDEATLLTHAWRICRASKTGGVRFNGPQSPNR